MLVVEDCLEVFEHVFQVSFLELVFRVALYLLLYLDVCTNVAIVQLFLRFPLGRS